MASAMTGVGRGSHGGVVGVLCGKCWCVGKSKVLGYGVT